MNWNCQITLGSIRRARRSGKKACVGCRACAFLTSGRRFDQAVAFKTRRLIGTAKRVRDDPCFPNPVVADCMDMPVDPDPRPPRLDRRLEVRRVTMVQRVVRKRQGAQARRMMRHHDRTTWIDAACKRVAEEPERGTVPGERRCRRDPPRAPGRRGAVDAAVVVHPASCHRMGLRAADVGVRPQISPQCCAEECQAIDRCGRVGQERDPEPGCQITTGL